MDRTRLPHAMAACLCTLMVLGCGSEGGGDAGAGSGNDTTGSVSDTLGGADASSDGAASTDGSAADTSTADTSSADTSSADSTAADTTSGDVAIVDSIGAPSCAVLKQQYQGMIMDAVSKHQACSAKSDCVVVQTSTACSGTCGQAVNKAGEADVKKAVANADSTVCKPNDYAGKCGYSTPSCAAPDPSCEQGKCVYMPTVKPGACPGAQPGGTECVGGKWVCKSGWFHPTPGAKSCLEATCANMSAAFGEAIAGTAATVKACKVDSDCVVVATSTACQGACGLPANKAEAKLLEDRVKWVDTDICQAFGYAKKCGYATPKCMAPNPGCEAGACVYAKGQP